LGHALGGLLAGMGTLPRRQPHTWLRDLAICALVACLPDIDFAWGRHNMETHSLGAALVAGVAVLLVSRRRDLAVACTLAWSTHVLFDWLGSDDFPPLGVMALWPVTDAFFFADAFVFDAITRRVREPGFWQQNLMAVAKELLILGPPALVLWWWRVRAHRA
jgi:hypothetical protein